jgi:hypothetical protein
MMHDVIASRGFTNDDYEQLNFFISREGVDLYLCIEDENKLGNLTERKFLITSEVCKELAIMFNSASKESENDTNKDPYCI